MMRKRSHMLTLVHPLVTVSNAVPPLALTASY